MSAVSDKVSLEQFRASYAECKPYYELLDGEAQQKAFPTKLHALLQGILYTLLRELGFRAMTELTLAIGETWEPTPDVCGLLGPDDGEPYPTRPLAVAIEVLSPRDPFTRVIQNAANTPLGAFPTFWFSILWAAKPGTGIQRPTISFASRKCIHARANPPN